MHTANAPSCARRWAYVALGAARVSAVLGGRGRGLLFADLRALQPGALATSIAVARNSKAQLHMALAGGAALLHYLAQQLEKEREPLPA